MEKTFDIVSVGDTTVDVFLEVSSEDAHKSCDVNNKDCQICFSYASKIPVSKLTRIAGVGNAANNAIGSSRLDLKTAIYTVTGSDQDSQETKRILEEEGVDTRLLVMENGVRSNFSAVINYGGERTIFVYHEPHNYNLPKIETDWIYFTSVGEGKEGLQRQLAEYVATSGVKLGFNPGSYHLKEGLENLRPLLEKTNVLLLNREEAEGLVGSHSAGGSAGQGADIEDTKGLLKSLKDTGPEIVVITDGPDGSYASVDGREVWYVGIPDTEVVERTGAGDAYSTGFLAATIKGHTLPEAMVWGTMNASSVVQHIGAREGLLTLAQIQKWVEKYKDQVKPRMV